MSDLFTLTEKDLLFGITMQLLIIAAVLGAILNQLKKLNKKK